MPEHLELMTCTQVFTNKSMMQSTEIDSRGFTRATAEADLLVSEPWQHLKYPKQPERKQVDMNCIVKKDQKVVIESARTLRCGLTK